MRTVRSGSAYSCCGTWPDFTFFSSTSHCAFSRLTSRTSSSSLAPSAAVRTMTDDSGSISSSRMPFNRRRSPSGSLREIPDRWPPG